MQAPPSQTIPTNRPISDLRYSHIYFARDKRLQSNPHAYCINTIVKKHWNPHHTRGPKPASFRSNKQPYNHQRAGAHMQRSRGANQPNNHQRSRPITALRSRPVSCSNNIKCIHNPLVFVTYANTCIYVVYLKRGITYQYQCINFTAT